MSKNTPGPWLVIADGVREGTDGGFEPFGGCGCCGSPWMYGDEKTGEDVANARLIAAAPDLLEALEACYAALSPYSEEGVLASAAIAKAKGVKP